MGGALRRRPGSGSRKEGVVVMEKDALPSVPYNLEAEKGVLSAVLSCGDEVDILTEILHPSDFYEKKHGVLYAAVIRLRDAGKPVDPVTVEESLRAAGEETLASSGFSEEIRRHVPIPESVQEYAWIVKDKSVRRKMLAASRKISERASDGKTTVEDLVEMAEAEVFAAGHGNGRNEFSPISEVVDGVLKTIAQMAQDRREVTGVPSGLRAVDKLTAGFQKTDLVIVAARPSMGKTAMAMGIACHAAMRHGIPVGIFSLEMSKGQLTMRMVCSEARVSMNRLVTGSLLPGEMDAVVRAAREVAKAPIYIDDSGTLTPSELKSRARRACREKGLGLVIVDYLQLMSARGSRGAENRTQEISEISRALKALAKEIDVPVIALSQLNRAVDGRQDKRPMLSDLRESGSIEQDSDLVLFIYREELYSKEDTPDDLRGVAEVIVGKQRNGPVGVALLNYEAPFTLFSDRAGSLPSPSRAAWGDAPSQDDLKSRAAGREE